jgi:hypothetical protein
MELRGPELLNAGLYRSEMNGERRCKFDAEGNWLD